MRESLSEKMERIIANTCKTFKAEYNFEHYPARSCIEVARLPKDALVEIEVVASR